MGTVSTPLPRNHYCVDAGMQVVSIVAPQWYEREDFRQFIDDPTSRLATWHPKGKPPSEFSDVFVTYDDGEGSDSDMPAEIWEEICSICRQLHVKYGLVWIKNLEIQ